MKAPFNIHDIFNEMKRQIPGITVPERWEETRPTFKNRILQIYFRPELRVRQKSGDVFNPYRFIVFPKKCVTFVPPHMHPIKEKLYFHQGNGIVYIARWIDDKLQVTCLANRGDIVDVPSGCWHAMLCTNSGGGDGNPCQVLVANLTRDFETIWG